MALRPTLITKARKNTMDNLIAVKIKDVYGRELVYPANETGYKFADLLGVKTFNEWQIAQIKNLGFQFQESSRRF